MLRHWRFVMRRGSLSQALGLLQAGRSCSPVWPYRFASRSSNIASRKLARQSPELVREPSLGIITGWSTGNPPDGLRDPSTRPRTAGMGALSRPSDPTRRRAGPDPEVLKARTARKASLPVSRGLVMRHQIEAFFRRWRNKVPGEPMKLLFGCRKQMIAFGVASTQTSQAKLIRHT